MSSDFVVRLLFSIALDNNNNNLMTWMASKLLSDYLSGFFLIVTEQLHSSGLLGPDGVIRSLGKWCKKTHKVESNPVPVGLQGGTRAATGNLISVGADGRGGKIKVLKSFHQSLVSILLS